MSDPSNPLLGFYARNQPYALPGPYQTELNPVQEMLFRLWLGAHNVPFDPRRQPNDYDMRGFWLGMAKGDPRAASATNPNDQQLHYPDYWKTPYHESFSAESQWAAPGAPSWNAQDQLVSPDGTVVLDERAKPKAGLK